MSRQVPRAELVRQLRSLGVREGEVLLVHTSFRAVRPVEGGPAGLVGALRDTLGAAGTLVMPSWTGDDDRPFDPATTPAAPDLGVVAETFRRLPGVVRSGHPFAFAAAGPSAESIVSGPLILPPHAPGSPVARVHEHDGRVLLLGVGHDADTTIHLAELLADVPYRVAHHCTIVKQGRPVRLDYGENDHCCARFALVDAWLRERGTQSEGTVGHAHARLVPAREVVDAVVERLQRDPLLFLHPPDASCVECDLARSSVSAARS